MSKKYESIEELDEETDDLIEKYKVAYASVLALLIKQIDKGYNYQQSATIIKEIDSILSNMDKKARSYLLNVFNQYYLLPLRKIDSTAIEISGVKKIQGAKHAIHREALKRATNDLYSDIAKNTEYMKREAKKIISSNAQELLTGMIESGESQKVIKKELKEKLLSSGISSFKDAGRKSWTIDRYADMLIRTKSRIIHNEGTMNRLKEYQERYSQDGEYVEDFDLIQISNHNAEDWCNLFEDKIFSISGRSETYPSIETLPNRPYEVLHPNCKHHYLAYIPSLNGKGKTISNKHQSLSIAELNKIDSETRKKKKTS